MRSLFLSRVFNHLKHGNLVRVEAKSTITLMRGNISTRFLMSNWAEFLKLKISWKFHFYKCILNFRYAEIYIIRMFPGHFCTNINETTEISLNREPVT